MSVEVAVVPDRCGNIACPNRSHEGRFAVVQTSSPVVGGHRPLRFWLCMPCAVAFQGMAAGPVTTEEADRG